MSVVLPCEQLLDAPGAREHLPPRLQVGLQLEGQVSHLRGLLLDERGKVLRDLVAESLELFERSVVPVERPEDDEYEKDDDEGDQITN